MKSYILGNKSESERLNFQSRQRNYSPRTEISAQELALFEDAKVLDAGCVLFPTSPTPLFFHLSDTSICNHHLV